MTALLLVYLVVMAFLIFGVLATERIGDFWLPARSIGDELIGILLLFYGATVWFVFVKPHRLSWSELGFRRFPPILILAIPAALVLDNLVSPNLNWLFSTLLRLPPPTDPAQFRTTLGQIIAAIIVAPLVEEFVFRGVLMRGISAVSTPLAGLIASSALFSIYHVDPHAFAGHFFAGILLGLLYFQSRSLWPCVGLHAAMNTLVLVLARLAS